MPRSHRLIGGTGRLSQAALRPNIHRIAKSGHKHKKKRNPKRKLVGGVGHFSKDSHQSRSKPNIHRIAKSGRGPSLSRNKLIARLKRMRMRRDVVKAKLKRCKLRRHKCKTISFDRKQKMHEQKMRYRARLAKLRAKILKLKAKCISAKRCKRRCMSAVMAQVFQPQNAVAAFEGDAIRRPGPAPAVPKLVSEKKALEVLRKIAQIRAPVEEVLDDDASEEKFNDYHKRQEKLVDQAQAERRKLLESIEVQMPQLDDALFAETARQAALKRAARLGQAPAPVAVLPPEPVQAVAQLPVKKAPRRVALIQVA